DVIQAGRSGRGRRSVAALPRVQSDVMVIAAGAEERRRRSHPRRDLEAEDAVVKREGPFEIGDFQVHMTDVDAGIDWLRHLSIIAQRDGRTKAGTNLETPSILRR